MKKKCDHPDEEVLQTTKDKPWEGTCQKCGKRVKLVAATAPPAAGKAKGGGG